MNKTKLEIIDIKEDIIVTSSNLAFTGKCYKFTNNGTNENSIETNDIYRIYDVNMDHGESFYINFDPSYFNEKFTNSGVTEQDGVWYAEYSDGVKYYFYECKLHDSHK